VKPDKLSDYQLTRRKIIAAQMKAEGSPMRTTRRYIEGNHFIYVTSTPFNSGAERDNWPSFGEYMTNMYGEEEYRRILEMARQSVKSRERFTIAYRPDLSWYEESPATN
jgi:hypothetical protein